MASVHVLAYVLPHASVYVCSLHLLPAMATACVEPRPLYCPRDPQAYAGTDRRLVMAGEPPQADVIEKILHGHQSAAMVDGLWRSAAARAPPTSGSGCSDSEPNELTYVDTDTFLTDF